MVSLQVPFWRNVAVIAIAHIAMIVTVVGWNRGARPPDLQGVVWMTQNNPELHLDSGPPQINEAVVISPSLDRDDSNTEEENDLLVPDKTNPASQTPNELISTDMTTATRRNTPPKLADKVQRKKSVAAKPKAAPVKKRAAEEQPTKSVTNREKEQTASSET